VIPYPIKITDRAEDKTHDPEICINRTNKGGADYRRDNKIMLEFKIRQMHSLYILEPIE
jgi:hypothetical protein